MDELAPGQVPSFIERPYTGATEQLVPPLYASNEAYHWEAVYLDGTVLDEYSVEGGRPFADIDIDRLHALRLIPQLPHLHDHILPVREGTRPIFFRRRTVTVNQVGEEVGRESVTVLGWQKTVEGRNVATFVFHFEDGSTVVSDDRDAI